MALIRCPECGKEISDKAELCIHCGFPINKYLSKECNNERQAGDNCKKEVQEVGDIIKGKQYVVEKISKKSLKKWKIVIGGLFAVCLAFWFYILFDNSSENKVDNLEMSSSDTLNDEEENNNSIDVKDFSIDDLKEKKLLEAINLRANGNYSEAIMILQSLDTYKNSIALLKQCMYEYAYEEYEKGNYFESITTLSNEYLMSYGNAMELRKQIIQEQKENYILLANEEYEKGNYEVAIEYFEAFLDYAEKENNIIYQYSYFMDSIQGDYISPVNNNVSSVHGSVFSINGVEYTVTPFEHRKNDNVQVAGMLNRDENNYILFIQDGEIWSITNSIDDEWDVWETEDFYIQNQERIAALKDREETIVDLVEPYIGMTHEEVEKSTWGKPEDINKTTYSWGTTEQWCYSNYRYIYFDNGIVTAIQE